MLIPLIRNIKAEDIQAWVCEVKQQHPYKAKK